MTQSSSERPCSAMMCPNQGKLPCTGCQGAEPETIYCGEGCQKRDSMFHKKYCGRDAYKFELILIGTSNPVIKRTFDVPSWYTFRQLHYTLQYAMGPWHCTHMHEFSFNAPQPPPPPSSSASAPSISTAGPLTISNSSSTPSSPRRRDDFSKKEGKEVLRIGPRRLYDITRMPMPGDAKLEMEDTVLLQDVFDPAGKLYDLVRVAAPSSEGEGDVYPLTYVYDFGDFWEHELVFKGKKLAREERPLFSSAQGCGPIEDCSSPSGWNRIKTAFRKSRSERTPTETKLLKWARESSGLGADFDPFKEPDVVQMNYEARWENHLEHYMQMEGEPLPERDWGEDEDWEGEESGNEEDD